jgi:hypothetical protein
MTSPPNDDSIPDQLPLHRRIPGVWVVPDENRGGVRISSGAFTGFEMSTVLDDTLRASGRRPEALVDGLANTFLAAVTAGLSRQLHQGVVRTPLADEPAHGDVIGDKSKAVRRRFARGAVWVVAPPAAA